MAKQGFIVVFNGNGARIIHGSGMGAISSSDQVVTNPDLSAVRGLPPHLWKLVNGNIVPMSDKEQLERLSLLGPDTSNSVLTAHLTKQRRIRVLQSILIAVGIAALCLILKR